MRIIAGSFKGRTLRGPTGPGVRPTSDSLRETLFNIMRDRVEGARFLDGFAGTGAVGLEALSRGASHATFVERDARVVGLLEKNVAACRVEHQVTVLKDLFAGVARRRGLTGEFDIVFIDPPYDIEGINAIIAEAASCVTPGGILVVEHGRKRTVESTVGAVERWRLLEAGDSALSFYRGPSAG